MIEFKPKLTDFLVFDLEAFVPPADRRRKTGPSLAVNPYRENHTLLGGVVYLSKPLTGEVVLDYAHHWIWTEGSETEVVASLYKVFADMWSGLKTKKLFQADPVVCGIGISTFDMPFLFTKCLQYEVAPPAEIYDTLGKCRIMDLSAAGIGFVPTHNPILHPCSHNELADALLPERERKPTGKKVWDMVDAKDYKAVEIRCEGEVREMVDLAEKMFSSQCLRNTV